MVSVVSVVCHISRVVLASRYVVRERGVPNLGPMTTKLERRGATVAMWDGASISLENVDKRLKALYCECQDGMRSDGDFFSMSIAAFLDDRCCLHDGSVETRISVLRIHRRWGVLLNCGCTFPDGLMATRHLSVPHLCYHIHRKLSAMIAEKDWALALAGILLAGTSTELEVMILPFKGRVREVVEAGGQHVLVLILLRLCGRRASAFVIEELAANAMQLTPESRSYDALLFLKWVCSNASWRSTDTRRAAWGCLGDSTLRLDRDDKFVVIANATVKDAKVEDAKDHPQTRRQKPNTRTKRSRLRSSLVR